MRSESLFNYGQKMMKDPNYNFMDNNDLVKAVTDVRLKSDIAAAQLEDINSNKKADIATLNTLLDNLGDSEATK